MAKSWLYEQERDNKALADKVSGWGDHYQLVAQEVNLYKRALYQNQSLKNIELVSCLVITLNDMR